MTTRRRIFLIDGSSQMYRAYHAIRGLTGPDGRSTNAVYGFVTMLRKLIVDHAPEYLAAAFDLAAPTFRSDLAADYKANRAPMPADLAEQIPLVHEACAALGAPIITHERYEADDVLGTLAQRAVEQGFEVALVTGDKDFFQLVGDGVRVYNPRDEGTWYDAAGVLAKFGVAPGQVVDVLSLMGDAIDNVKGVPGIGEKGARDLIATWGSLDALLANAASLPQRKYREALAQHADAARQARELVSIHTDVPLDCDLERFRYRGASQARCFELFSRLGFRSLVAAYAPTAATVETDYAVAASREAVAALASEVRTAGWMSLHPLSEGRPPMRATLLGLAVSTAAHRARYVPHVAATAEATAAAPRPDGPAPDLFTALDAPAAAPGSASPLAGLRGVLEDDAIRKIGHDLKTTGILLANAGIALCGLDADSMLQSYVIDATRSGHDVEGLALEHLSYRAMAADELTGRGARAVPLGQLAADRLCAFASERADLAARLVAQLGQRLAQEGLDGVYRTLELPLVPVLVDMERAGVRVDTDVLATLAARLDRELAARTERIHRLAGTEFNINSPRQLSEVLFDKLQLPVTKKTGKTRSASTAVEVLEELAAQHDLPREILEWRAMQKLKGTYVDALPVLVDRVTGRVHTSVNQAVAATGRLSSSDPNVQNIPIRTELGREIRRAFVAEPGCVLISADYSQIELRVLAHLSGDAALVEAFARGEDIHDRTAAAVFGEHAGLDRYELRRRAKIINYALLYGKTAFTLARDIGVSQASAQAFIDAYFAGFPGVRRFIDDTLARARETGTVTTLFGRRRLVPEITSRNGQVRAGAERIAVNLPIQGTAADILKLAMIDLHGRLAARGTRVSGATRPPARMILTVHDELVFEVPREEADEVAVLVRERMAAAAALDVPLEVDVGIGENWCEAKP
jgi:DNA polymerase-1